MKVVRHTILFFVGLYVVLASAMFYINVLITNGSYLSVSVDEVRAEPRSLIQPTNIPTPTTTPTSTPTPTIAIGKPATIEIPKIFVNTLISTVAIAPDNTMETPKDYSHVGWYSLGSQPGHEGAAIINGHYDDTLGKPAVFYKLSDLVAGDEVIIKTENEKELKFRVESAYSEDYSSFPKELVYSQYNGKGIRLITCDGVWDPEAKTYSKRLVVNARLIEIK